MRTKYTDVQFLGYAIPSIPQQIADIGGADDPGFVEGRYVGIEPETRDIEARIELTMSAVRQAVERGKVDTARSTLKIFVMPEFTFRGKKGAYDARMFARFCRQFARRVGVPAYEGWLFVVGTIVNTEKDYHRGEDRERDREARVREDLAIALANTWQHCSTFDDPKFAAFTFKTLTAYTKYCHAHPLYVVTDRSYLVAGGAPDAKYPNGLSVEKKFLSNEDFVLNFYTNVNAEEDVAYPPIDEKFGENKRKPFDDFSIFTIKGIKFGLEVCLDHYRARLRCNRRPKTELVQIQLIPSCGMQIVQPSIIAAPGGLVFNCDGQYAELGKGSTPGPKDSIWTAALSGKAHTQLTQVVTRCSGNDPKHDMAELRKPAAKVTRVRIRDDASKIYAYGAGEVHVYTPLPVPPPVPRSRAR
jgi:hypothetical protein